MVGGERGAGRPPVMSSLRRTIVGGGRRMIRVYLVPAVGFANAVVAGVGIFSMVGGESGAGRPPVLSSLRRTIVGGGSAAQGTNDQGVSCSRRGIRQRRRGQIGIFSMVGGGRGAGRPRS